jgi:hypothetical protein
MWRSRLHNLVSKLISDQMFSDLYFSVEHSLCTVQLIRLSQAISNKRRMSFGSRCAYEHTNGTYSGMVMGLGLMDSRLNTYST